MLQKVRMTDGRRMGDGGRVTEKASYRETNKQTKTELEREIRDETIESMSTTKKVKGKGWG